MTLHEVKREISRYQFKGMMGLMKPSFQVDLFQGIFTVRMSMVVPDRNTGEPVPLRSEWSVVQDCPEEHFHWGFQAFLREFWSHEFDEGLQRDGERLRERHT